MTISTICAKEYARTRSHSTGKERDSESGNDYFEARYYSSTMGRFMSPDWSAKLVPVPYATLGDPQSLNLYSYLKNNPLGGVDADGHCGGPGDPPCNEVHVEETQKAKPKVLENVQAANGQVGTGVVANVEITVTHHGDPIKDVKVEESNNNTLTVNGTNKKITTLEGPLSPTNKFGQTADTVSSIQPNHGDKALSAELKKDYSTDSVRLTSVQTLTLTLPGGENCTDSITRTLTNIKKDGSVSSQYLFSAPGTNATTQ